MVHIAKSHSTRGRMVRRTSAVAIVGAMMLAACGSDPDASDSSAPSSTGGGSDTALVIARGMDVNSLDPSLAYCDTCQIYMTAVYETLIGLDSSDNQTLVPRLATAWEGNAEQTEFTFTLRPGTIDVSIGQPIPSSGREPDELMREVERWIEAEMRRLDPHAYAASPARA